MNLNESEVKSLIGCLDQLGVALARHDHKWSNEERQAYEASIALLTSGDCMETGSSASD